MNMLHASIEQASISPESPEVAFSMIPETLADDPEFQLHAVDALYTTAESLFTPREFGVDDEGNPRYFTFLRNMKQNLGIQEDTDLGRLRLIRIRQDEVGETAMAELEQKDPEVAGVLRSGSEALLAITLDDAAVRLPSLRSEVEVYKDALNGRYRQAVLASRPRIPHPPLYDLI